jgi:hypothetical protein
VSDVLADFTLLTNKCRHSRKPNFEWTCVRLHRAEQLKGTDSRSCHRVTLPPEIRPRARRRTRDRPGGCHHDCDKSSLQLQGGQRKYCASCRHRAWWTRGETASCAKSNQLLRRRQEPLLRRPRAADCVCTRVTCDVQAATAPRSTASADAPLLRCDLHAVPGMVRESGRPGPAPVHGASDARDPRQACNLCQSHSQAGHVRSPRKRCTQEVTCIDFATHWTAATVRVSRQPRLLRSARDAGMIDHLDQVCVACNLRTSST